MLSCHSAFLSSPPILSLCAFVWGQPDLICHIFALVQPFISYFGSDFFNRHINLSQFYTAVSRTKPKKGVVQLENPALEVLSWLIQEDVSRVSRFQFVCFLVFLPVTSSWFSCSGSSLFVFYPTIFIQFPMKIQVCESVI